MFANFEGKEEYHVATWRDVIQKWSTANEERFADKSLKLPEIGEEEKTTQVIEFSEVARSSLDVTFKVTNLTPSNWVLLSTLCHKLPVCHTNFNQIIFIYFQWRRKRHLLL